MTRKGCARPRTVRITPQPSFRIRGLDAKVDLFWPTATLGSGADYHVDFSDHLCCDETLVKVAFSLAGGVLGWSGKPTFGLKTAAAWITWTAKGKQMVEVTALTSGGRSLTAFVHIHISPQPSLLSGDDTLLAPNILTLPDGTPLTTDRGHDLLSQ
ncbi:hypothetical protein [Swingsia samuiensis]|uniref:Uncharacterized protein n=1 Tax=Swingsia samuiensis TaxID=1293412 RepID=A0A4Y6ULX1_9PROT|nr:hypothetical protein [Swingsia samuiensis]QDH17391.1 hypothetical protein E3D00_07310 [Swingsia samuiensis]